MASAWNLSRLDALAAEVQAVLDLITDGMSDHEVSADGGLAVTVLRAPLQGLLPKPSRGAEDEDMLGDTSGYSSSSAQSADPRELLDSASESASAPLASNTELGSISAAESGSDTTVSECAALEAADNLCLVSGAAQQDAASTEEKDTAHRGDTSRASDGESQYDDGGSTRGIKTSSTPQLLALAAVNDVMFHMQGYRHMELHGDPWYAPT